MRKGKGSQVDEEVIAMRDENVLRVKQFSRIFVRALSERRFANDERVSSHQPDCQLFSLGPTTHSHPHQHLAATPPFAPHLFSSPSTFNPLHSAQWFLDCSHNQRHPTPTRLVPCCHQPCDRKGGITVIRSHYRYPL